MSDHRAVAFFDVLGFKALLEKHSASELGDKYKKVLNNLNMIEWTVKEKTPLNKSIFETKTERLCSRYIFSDSIILVSLDETEDSALKLLYFAFRLIQFLVAPGFPVRGGVTYGQLYEDEIQNVVVGSALVKAANIEASQEWIGAIIDDTLTNTFPSIFSKENSNSYFLSRLFPEYEVPLKAGAVSKNELSIGGGSFTMQKVQKRYYPILQHGMQNVK